MLTQLARAGYVQAGLNAQMKAQHKRMNSRQVESSLNNWTFRVPDLNALYSMPYEESVERWRAICAIDKLGHIVDLAGARQSEIESVLEVGCGTGDVLKQLKSTNFGTRLVGIEIGSSKRAESHIDDGIEFTGYDGATVPFEKGQFDFVYATHVLEHVPHPRLFLSELRRVSRRFVFVEVPCELNVKSSVKSLQESLDLVHINCFTPESFALTLETSGLKILKLKVFDHSKEVYEFRSTVVKAAIRRALRRTLLRTSKYWATRVFTFHCAALCELGEPLKL